MSVVTSGGPLDCERNVFECEDLSRSGSCVSDIDLSVNKSPCFFFFFFFFFGGRAALESNPAIKQDFPEYNSGW